MIVKTLDNKEYDWTISDKIAKGNRRKCSGLHNIAREVLRQKYPNSEIYEEVPIIIEGRQKLYLDFYCPMINLAIEVNGEQHYSFTARFHENKLDFLKSIVNDRKKKDWCNLNDIQLVTLKYNEVEEWPNLV